MNTFKKYGHPIKKESENMTTDQKEKRNDEYNKYVKRVTPTHCLSANMLKAFIPRRHHMHYRTDS